MKNVSAKVVVLGPHGAGKTSLVLRYQNDYFNPKTNCTIGASFSSIYAVIRNVKIKMQVWDTAGQERFRAMAPMYYRGANAVVFVFDITSKESFADLKTWANDMLSLLESPNIVLVLAGNKSDLKERRRVTKQEAEEYAAEIGSEYIETSALGNLGIGNLGVNELFERIGELLLEREPHAGEEGHLADEKEKSYVLSDEDLDGSRKLNKCC